MHVMGLISAEYLTLFAKMSLNTGLSANRHTNQHTNAIAFVHILFLCYSLISTVLLTLDFKQDTP